MLNQSTLNVLAISEQRRKVGFSIAFAETNLRWLLGETPRRQKLINKTRKVIYQLRQKEQAIPNPFEPLKQIGHYLTVIASGGLHGENMWGKIAIFGKRVHNKLGTQVLVKSFGEYAWINISKNYIVLGVDNPANL